jgi:hypothetical protein
LTDTNVDLARIQAALERFIERERTRFETLARTGPQILEVGALTIVAEHYRRDGWSVEVRNLRHGLFRTKLSASGKAWNFSWFECSRKEARIEIHGNLPVESATPLDSGIYVVDVGVVRVGSVSALQAETHPGRGLVAVANEDAISFLEAKKLVIYPMLLAQFVGIVHEIKPDFLRPVLDADDTVATDERHLRPALVSVGPLGATSADIIAGFARRGFRLNVIPTFDQRITNLIDDPLAPSPFATDPVRQPRPDPPFRLFNLSSRMTGSALSPT